MSTQSFSSQVAVIDTRIEDYEVLEQAALEAGLEVIRLEADGEGIESLAASLEDLDNIDSLHIFSHGDAGTLALGDDVLTTHNLGDHTEALSIISDSLSEDADLLLYGCNIGNGAEGVDFIHQLALLSGADIAASDDLTGSNFLGGDWDLEIRSGEIETYYPFSDIALRDFSSVLAINDNIGRTITTAGFSNGYSNTKSYDVDGSGYVLRISTSSVSANAIYCDSISLNYCAMNFGGALTDIEQLYIDFVGGSSFDIDSLQVYSPAGNNTYVFTPSSGTPINGNGFDTGFTTQVLNFTNITRLTITRQDNGDLNGFDIDNLVIKNATAANATPTISIDNAALSYTENGTAIQIDSAATLSDSDGDSDWNGGTLVAQITANNEAADELSIPDNVVGTINTSGTSLRDGATTIGTLSASEGTVTNGTALTITFNSNATNALVQQTLRAIHYQNTSNDPGTSNRTITLTATDKNAGSNADTRTVSVTAVNDAPTGMPTDITVTEDSASNVDLSAVTFTDIDGVSLTVTLTASAGTFSTPADGAGVGGGVTETLVSGTVITLTGAAADINTYLDTASNIKYTGAANVNGDNAATLTIKANDGTVNPTLGSVNIDITAVNDAPTLTATGSNPTFTEGGAAAGLFSGSSVSTIESGQTLSALTLTVTNVNNGFNEILNTDGTAIVLTHGTSGTTATNSLSYSVSVSGTTATVSLSGGTLSTAATQTLINGISYQNNSNTPNTSNRVVTITSLQDSGGTANGGDDTAALAIASTVTVVGVNDEPTLTATGSNPTFTEGGAAAGLFSGASASTIESGQTLTALTLTVTNVNDGSNELLNTDGTAIVLTNGTSGTTASNSLSYSVSVAGDCHRQSFGRYAVNRCCANLD